VHKLAIKPPLTDLPIQTESDGFYEGFNKIVTLGGKGLLGLLIIWALVFPPNASAILGNIQSLVMNNFGTWYVFVVCSFFVTCIGLAIWPTTGRMRLSPDPNDRPEFSNFSWFSMMFSAGIGIGMLTYATAEPIYHFQNNPDVIQGLSHTLNEDNVRAAYKWSFLHWGFAAWCCYALAGLSLAFFSYRRGLPLTIRSGITSIFGKSLSGNLGNVVDITSVIATVLGVAVTLGVGVNQFASAIYKITGWDWVLNADGKPVASVVIVSIIIIMLLSTLSALSGVGKGIKWLSNINLSLSIFLLGFLIIFGSTLFGLEALMYGMWDLIVSLPSMMTTIWTPEVDATGAVVKDAVSSQLASWQGGWTIFYWAWWVAFAPFVGLFLARISRGRTIREFIIGAALAPSIMCFLWFTFAGGTAIDLELRGLADGRIIGAPDTQQLFETMDTLLSPALSWAMAVVIFVLLLTYLVTTVDSAILIVNTINAAGDPSAKHPVHIILWGVALGLVMASLLLLSGTNEAGESVSGLAALRSAMIIGALPFSLVMFLMCFAVIKAAIRDGLREKAGLQTTYHPIQAAD
jgi:choline/carnitine/betaine transport